MKQANLWRHQLKLGGFQILTDFKSLDSININKLILWKVARMEHLAPSSGIAQSTQGLGRAQVVTPTEGRICAWAKEKAPKATHVKLHLHK